MHATSLSLLLLAAAASLAVASPLSTSDSDRRPQLARRQLNPISFGFGTAAVNQAKKNEALAQQLQTQVQQLQQECSQLEGREQMIQRGGGGNNLRRRQLGTVLGGVSIHKNHETNEVIGTMGDQLSSLRQRTNALINAERLGPGSPFTGNNGNNNDPTLVRRFLFSGTITAIKGHKDAKKNWDTLQTYQSQISQIQADLARVRTSQDVRLSMVGPSGQIVNQVEIAFRRPGPPANNGQWGSDNGVNAASSDRGRGSNYGSGQNNYGSNNGNLAASSSNGRSYGSSQNGNLASSNDRSSSYDSGNGRTGYGGRPSYSRR